MRKSETFDSDRGLGGPRMQVEILAPPGLFKEFFDEINSTMQFKMLTIHITIAEICPVQKLIGNGNSNRHAVDVSFQLYEESW